MRRHSTSLLVAITLLLHGCMTGGPAGTRPDASRLDAIETQLEKVPIGNARSIDDHDTLAINAEIKHFLARYLEEFPDPRQRVTMLKYVITHPGVLAFHYDHGQTRTARDAFELRSGNCLTLSNLFIAMARHLGVDAHFQEVSLGNSWTKKDDLYLLNRHINVTGKMPGRGNYVMDFIHIDTEHAPGTKVVSDVRAKAQYYNNLGVTQLQAGEHQKAASFFKKGIRTDPDIDYIWSNLATTYGRVNELLAAEAAFKQALDINPRNWSAINNLALVYRKMGRVAEAEHQLAGIEKFRLNNPYYRAELSEHAYQQGDYREAITQIKKAIAIKPEEHEFYFALAKSYYRQGDRGKATTHFRKAKDLVANHPEPTKFKARYKADLDSLFGDQVTAEM